MSDKRLEELKTILSQEGIDYEWLLTYFKEFGFRLVDERQPFDVWAVNMETRPLMVFWADQPATEYMNDVIYRIRTKYPHPLGKDYAIQNRRVPMEAIGSHVLKPMSTYQEAWDD
jgi:hypothetical protein